MPDNSYDGGFSFEATCHAKDMVVAYKELLRVLKPGALFVDMCWTVTDTYNPQNPKHFKVINDIMVSMLCHYSVTTVTGLSTINT